MKTAIRRLLTTILLLSVVAQARLTAQEATLAAAKDLYAAAAYEEALNVLDTLKGSATVEDNRGIEQYRAFCLLALGRKTDAERAIEEVVSAEPMYQPDDDVSPRVRTVFADVRRRMLPAIAQQKYAQAKATFDRKEYPAAAEQFKALLDVMNDPTLDLNRQPGLADLRVLAGGFMDLAAAAATPPPVPEPAPAPSMASVPAPVAPPQIFAATDRDVVPPVVVRQEFPRWPRAIVPNVPAGRGVLEVLVTEAGDVDGATMREPVNPVYDRMVVSAAKTWKYRPATKDGQPVKYRKLIQVTLMGQ